MDQKELIKKLASSLNETTMQFIVENNLKSIHHEMLVALIKGLEFNYTCHLHIVASMFNNRKISIEFIEKAQNQLNESIESIKKEL